MSYKISFKSTPINYRKEYLGLKKNTIRKQTEKEDIRFEIMDRYINNEINHLKIEISNTLNNEMFSRSVSDITKYDGYYIISWME